MEMEGEDSSLGIHINLGKGENVRQKYIPYTNIQNTPQTYVGVARGESASDKVQPKVNSNFRPLVADPVSTGVNIYSRKVVKKVNSEADLVDVVNIGILSFTRDDFSKELIWVKYEWRPPRCDLYKIFGHIHDHCPKREVSPPIVTTSNIFTPTVEKTNDGFQTLGKKKKKKDNITSSNYFSALNVKDEEEEEDVENVYDETANLFLNTKTGGSSSFTVAGYIVSLSHLS
nr:hypothetical protein [Tanacetum cinerariifolium]